MTKKSVPPSIKETAFDCPHCGAYTTQDWFGVYAEHVGREERVPFVPDEQARKVSLSDKDISAEVKAKIQDWFEELASGQVFLQKRGEGRYLCRPSSLFAALQKNALQEDRNVRSRPIADVRGGRYSITRSAPPDCVRKGLPWINPVPYTFPPCSPA